MADHPKADTVFHKAAANPQLSIARHSVAAAFLGDPSQPLDVDILIRLEEVVLSGSGDNCEDVITDLQNRGLAPEDLADFYIPALARHLGDRWCVDSLSFAAVTIGVSRLQWMLRHLGRNWSGGHTQHPSCPTLLLIVPRDVHHTLGAIVLSGQIRRKGVSVKLLLGARPDDVAQQLEHSRYDAVFLSSSRGEALESLGGIVDAVKTSAKRVPPVVIGGTILEVARVHDVLALTGADHATKNLDEALKLCGLLTPVSHKVHATLGT